MSKETNKLERLKMVMAMEFIARQVNNEEVFEEWLINGVADGDIPYGATSIVLGSDVEAELSYYIEDDTFAELMGLFLNLMNGARKDGGLYCDNVVSK